MESQTREYQEVWRDEWLRPIAAFANSDGGVLCASNSKGKELNKINRLKELDIVQCQGNNKPSYWEVKA